MKKQLVLVEEKKKEPLGKWTTGADVMMTFKRFGFVPPTEYRTDYLFGTNRAGGTNG